jgi:hypothetical protein
MKNYDIRTINSNAHNFLAQAQEDLESAIAAFAKASDDHAEAEMRLRIAREDAILMLKEQKMPATLILDLSKGKATASLKAESMKAESRVKHAQHLIRSIENRINSVKFIGRRTDEAAQ